MHRANRQGISNFCYELMAKLVMILIALERHAKDLASCVIDGDPRQIGGEQFRWQFATDS